MKLRSSLLVLCLIAALPIAAFGVLTAGWVIKQENDSLVRAAKERNRATIGAVEAEVRGAINALKALSTSRSLTNGDLQTFHDEAVAALESQNGWSNVLLHDVTASQLANARLPWGSELLNKPVSPRSIEAVISTQQPAVDDLSSAPKLNNELGIPVRVPVTRNGELKYVLTAVLRSETFQRLLDDQRLPDNWVSGLVDRKGRVFARVPRVAPGTMASANYLEQIGRADEGWYRGATIEGKDTYTAFLRSSLTGWTIGYALPAEVVLTGVRRAAWLLGTGIVLSIGAAILIGLWLARRLAEPMTQLAGAAAALPEGVEPALPESSIVEIAALSTALRTAAHSIASRDSALRQQADELVHANTKKSEFLALLAHELRNPLAPLRNGVALITLQRDPQRLAETQAMMERQVSHMARLVEDLIDVSRIDRGQLDLRRERVAIDAVIAAALETVKPVIESRRQQLVVRYAPANICVDGDPVRLSQVVSNLLNNASKFTPADGSIEVVTEADGSHVVIEVSDTGIGFHPSDEHRIFDLFVQADHDLSKAAGGLGLGLTLVKSIVEMHGGTIEARSQGLGTGARFIVRLPAAEALPLTTPSSALPKPTATVKVLVVDDNRDAAASLAEVLRLEGFDARASLDGAEAIELARTFKPDVAFVDLHMPRMSGIEFAQRIRNEPWSHGVRLAAVTGMGQRADVDETRAAGFDAHFIKPVSVKTAIAFALRSKDNVIPMWPEVRKEAT